MKPAAARLKSALGVLQPDQEMTSSAYRQWRHGFVLSRLRLAFVVAIAAFLVFFVFNFAILIPVTRRSAELDWATTTTDQRDYFFSTAIQLLGLLLGLVLLRLAKMQRHPWRLFLLINMLVLLLASVLTLSRGEVYLDLLTWLLLIMLQGLLIPVCWRWHLLTQLACTLPLLILIALPNIQLISVPTDLQLVFALQVTLCLGLVCLITDFGIYLYEGVLQREFDLKERLQFFLHAVSHDLRTPVMGSIMVLNQALKTQQPMVLLPATTLVQMRNSHERQLQLINTLLESHHSQVHGIEIFPQPHSLPDLIKVLLQERSALYPPGAIQLELWPDLPPIYGDALQIQRVYDNLISNALQYNRPGVSVILRAWVVAGWMHCQVSDNGQGLGEPAAATRIFEPYATPTTSHQPLNLGLGLYICRRIVEAHGGQISASSHPAQGTTIVFTLPLAPDCPR
ncbi:HAMP domain-containing histidine kinase [Nodosilinea sp. LEGE 07088]|uniref:sensor histidine kinase n=1 Tax=Nodosilinea sp. LEGE 07088 TaxID=2777968 RepID=UPI001880F643|nr:HAMP domain-containing sensor histidine kinase [Nodosilinea sp. LEGE 07088]MBE9137287.1 HAMP domain-containing histidine kinase [Nodosilinea sp. LEGE 07088]